MRGILSRGASRLEQGYPSMGKQPDIELIIPEEKVFDYSQLAAGEANKLRATAKRIRDKVKKSFASIVEIGRELQKVKESLPHGQFGPWLKAEFGWGERNARNFMAVAGCFHDKTATIADLSLDPTAAYLLASPSTPEEIRTQAIQKAEAGEHVGPTLVRKMLQEAREQSSESPQRLMLETLERRVKGALDRYLEKYDESDRAAYAKVLRNYADSIDPKKPRQPRKRSKAT